MTRVKVSNSGSFSGAKVDKVSDHPRFSDQTSAVRLVVQTIQTCVERNTLLLSLNISLIRSPAYFFNKLLLQRKEATLQTYVNRLTNAGFNHYSLGMGKNGTGVVITMEVQS